MREDFNSGLLLRTVRLVLVELDNKQRTIRYRDFWLRTVQILVAPQIHWGTTTLESAADRLCNSDDPNHQISLHFVALFQKLLSDGHLVPWPSKLAIDTSHVFLTPRGRKWLTATEPYPENIAGYMSTLLAAVPSLDYVVRQYISEALNTFDQRNFFAAAVLLGAASERLTYLMPEAIQEATKDVQKKNRLANVMNKERNVSEMFRLIDGAITAAKSAGMPYAVYESSERQLLAVQESVRVQRNEAVHPQAAQVSPDSLRLSLSAFVAACKKIYALKSWFEQNSI